LKQTINQLSTCFPKLSGVHDVHEDPPKVDTAKNTSFSELPANKRCSDFNKLEESANRWRKYDTAAWRTTLPDGEVSKKFFYVFSSSMQL
jgi:hypothetical protein